MIARCEEPAAPVSRETRQCPVGALVDRRGDVDLRVGTCVGGGRRVARGRGRGAGGEGARTAGALGSFPAARHHRRCRDPKSRVNRTLSTHGAPGEYVGVGVMLPVGVSVAVMLPVAVMLLVAVAVAVSEPERVGAAVGLPVTVGGAVGDDVRLRVAVSDGGGVADGVLDGVAVPDGVGGGDGVRDAVRLVDAVSEVDSEGVGVHVSDGVAEGVALVDGGTHGYVATIVYAVVAPRTVLPTTTYAYGDVRLAIVTAAPYKPGAQPPTAPAQHDVDTFQLPTHVDPGPTASATSADVKGEHASMCSAPPSGASPTSTHHAPCVTDVLSAAPDPSAQLAADGRPRLNCAAGPALSTADCATASSTHSSPAKASEMAAHGVIRGPVALMVHSADAVRAVTASASVQASCTDSRPLGRARARAAGRAVRARERAASIPAHESGGGTLNRASPRALVGRVNPALSMRVFPILNEAEAEAEAEASLHAISNPRGSHTIEDTLKEVARLNMALRVGFLSTAQIGRKVRGCTSVWLTSVCDLRSTRMIYIVNTRLRAVASSTWDRRDAAGHTAGTARHSHAVSGGPRAPHLHQVSWAAKQAGLTLAAVASRDLAKAEAFAKANGFAKAYGSYAELLADPDIDAVYIPLPTRGRGDWVIEAAQAKKHVLCEKPCAVDLAELTRMVRACASNGVQVGRWVG